MLGASEQCLSEASGTDAKSIPGDLYESDDFRLYCYKILPCSRRTPHEWSSCPFAHPGEKAKRRNIRTHIYDCEMCPSAAKGVGCLLGPKCPHSHNVFESWLHPQKYRTLLCKDKHRCTRAVCFFAHGEAQLRTPGEPYAVFQPGAVMLPATASRTSSGSSSNSIATSMFGSSGNLAASQLALPGHSAAAWPLTATVVTAAADGAPTKVVDMQQMLAALVSNVQAAQQEAHEQQVAAQQAQQQLEAVTAAVVGQQAARAAAAGNAAENLEALSRSSLLQLSLQQQQHHGTLNSSYGSCQTSGLYSLASSYPLPMQTSMLQGNMASLQPLAPMAAAAACPDLTQRGPNHVGQLYHLPVPASAQHRLKTGGSGAGLLLPSSAALLGRANCFALHTQAHAVAGALQFGVAGQQVLSQAAVTQDLLGHHAHILDNHAPLYYA